MSRYDDGEYTNNPNMRQKDLVLSTNEFCFLQNRTNGAIKTYTGPIMLTISQQESLVIFNSKTKRFEETTDFERARQLFTSAPEGWYVVLKNPSKDGTYPEAAKAVNSPELNIGRKINISGPCSFSLFPGQMANVIQGHRLRSNQYLLARVYDAEAAEANRASATIVNTSGEEVSKVSEGTNTPYYAGQLLVIKGTEISFYMPPTGIEVLSVGTKDGSSGNKYIRDAVTLERLEYAILKDEDGEKRYVHGPAVVFPKPTETFVETPKGGNIFRALELSPISGIYIKVIAEYTDKDKDGKEIIHPIGEELFITGKDQMIYYPRPEHAMIQYDGKYMHHAIAIPEGEGRYILNRLTGEIKTIKGPNMYLADPRFEVVVKRKLTKRECELFYPDNEEVLRYNVSLTGKNVEKMVRKGCTDSLSDIINTAYSTSNQEDTLAIFEANANISRGVSYTKPRTITLDTKFDGVVSIDVFTGYAVNVISRTGKKEIIIGPKTRLLDYDETLEAMELSTGKPKTTDELLKTVYLHVENNKVADIIRVQTKDFVFAEIKLSYCVNFLEKYKDKWFSINNYVKYLCDRERSLLKREVKKYTIEEFYANSFDIIRNTVLGISTEKAVIEGKPAPTGMLFEENGMFVYDVEVLNLKIDSNIADMLEDHQYEIIQKTLELSEAEQKAKVIEELSKCKKREAELQSESELYKLQLQKEYDIQRYESQKVVNEKEQALKESSKQAEADLQKLIDSIEEAKLARNNKINAAKIETENKFVEIERARKLAYSEAVEKIMKSISPNLVAALNARSNSEIMECIGDAIAPYSMAKGESLADTVNTLLRGTSLEKTLKNIKTFDVNTEVK